VDLFKLGVKWIHWIDAWRTDVRWLPTVCPATHPLAHCLDTAFKATFQAAIKAFFMVKFGCICRRVAKPLWLVNNNVAQLAW
jgi:hypothetical protein